MSIVKHALFNKEVKRKDAYIDNDVQVYILEDRGIHQRGSQGKGRT